MTKKNYSVNPNQSSSESLLRNIRRNTKRIFTSEQNVIKLNHYFYPSELKKAIDE